MELIQLGAHIDFISEVHTEFPKAEQNTCADAENMKLITAKVDKLLKKGVIREVTRVEARKVLGFYSKMGTVPKKDPTQ